LISGSIVVPPLAGASCAVALVPRPHHSSEAEVEASNARLIESGIFPILTEPRSGSSSSMNLEGGSLSMSDRLISTLVLGIARACGADPSDHHAVDVRRWEGRGAGKRYAAIRGD
jgi:hypothetical protein